MCKRRILIFSLLIVGILSFAQEHNSIPLNSPIYDLLENAEGKDYIYRLPRVKPYQKSFVIDALKKIIVQSEEGLERTLYERALEDLTQREKGLMTGSYEWRDDEHNISVEIGAGWYSMIGGNLNPPHQWTTENWLTAYIRGDLGEFVSYDTTFKPGFYDIDTEAYEPYSFTRHWDGAVFPPEKLNKFQPLPYDFSFGIAIESEINASFLENKAQLRFGRIRHQWGDGIGSLFLTGQARPFMAVEGSVLPFDWIGVHFMTGVLEFAVERTDDLKAASSIFQNAYSAFQIDITPCRWFDFSVFSGVIWPKRFELGYLYPINSNYMYQNVIGDFDNLSLGATLGFNVPGYARFYFNAYVDEMNLLVEDFLHKDRNMYSLQGGIKIYVPKIPSTTIAFQYTKIEPYCYTHPQTEVPWYSQPIYGKDNDGNTIVVGTEKMETAYMNNGEGLGYPLKPNSDELLFEVRTHPLYEVEGVLNYRMIRHGADYGSGLVDGSSLASELEYSDLKTTKYFLKDGVYEWFHIVSLGGSYDFTSLGVPIKVGLDYDFVYLYHTQGTGNDNPYQRIDNEEYGDEVRNNLTLQVWIYP